MQATNYIQPQPHTELLDAESTSASTEENITVAEAVAKLEWDEKPTYKQNLLRLAYQINEDRRSRKHTFSATAKRKKKDNRRTAKLSRKKNRR